MMDFHDSAHLSRLSQVGVACRLGDVNLLKDLLMMGADCNISDNRGWKPLHEAAFSGHHPCLKAILESPNGVDVDRNARAHDGTTPLLLACKRCCLKSVEVLCQNGADPDLGSLDDMTPLIAVTEKYENDCVGIMRVLINHGAHINKTYFNGWTSLHNAAASCNIHAVKLLLEHGASPSAVDSDNVTPVFLSVQYGSIACLEALLQASDEPASKLVNRVSKDSVSCMYVAAQEGYDTIVRELITYGADCNVPTDDGLLPIIAAIKNGYTRCFKLLIPHTSRDLVNTLIEDPVFVAVESRASGCLKILISNGYDVNKLKEGDYLRFPTPIYRYLQPLLAKMRCTPLGRAVVITSLEICGTLLQGRAQPNFTDEETFSPFLLAILKRKYPELLQAFLKHGVDINSTTVNSLSRTPDSMLIAVHPVYKKQLDELLKAGLDPSLPFWCQCHSPSHVEDGYCFLKEINSLLSKSDMQILLKTLLIYSKTIPFCCDLWRETWSNIGMVDLATSPKCLKDLCRLEIRKCLPSRELYATGWHEQLPLPPFLRRFLTFANDNKSYIHNLYRN